VKYGNQFQDEIQTKKRREKRMSLLEVNTQSFWQHNLSHLEETPCKEKSHLLFTPGLF
jgi:hypothetical protein